MRKVLLVCPTFFDYYKSIIEGLERKGFGVIWCDSRICEHSFYKLILRLFPNFVSRFSTAAQIRRLMPKIDSNITDIVVVRGEGIAPAVITFLRKTLPNARFHLYLWDGVNNTSYIHSIAPLFDTVSTFDPIDAEKYGWHHRPLFSRNSNQNFTKSPSDVSYDFVFIGSIHSDRWKVLRRIFSSSSQFSSFVYGYIPGKLVWCIRHILDLTLWLRGEMIISIKSLPAETVNKYVSDSKAVLDIEHPYQRGLTMRTIETLTANRKLITTNQTILCSDLYDPSRVLVIDRANPVIPPEFFISDFKPIEPAVCDRYNIESWLDEILRGPQEIESY